MTDDVSEFTSKIMSGIAWNTKSIFNYLIPSNNSTLNYREVQPCLLRRNPNRLSIDRNAGSQAFLKKDKEEAYLITIFAHYRTSQ